MIKELALRFVKKEIDVAVRDAVVAERSKLDGEIKVLKSNDAAMRATLESEKRELLDVRKLVRDQSEADMILASLKIIAAAVGGKNGVEMSVLAGQQYAAQMQMSAMNSAVGQSVRLGYSEYQNLLGGIGSAVFGGNLK